MQFFLYNICGFYIIFAVFSASEMTYIVSGGALNSTHSLAVLLKHHGVNYRHYYFIKDCQLVYQET